MMNILKQLSVIALAAQMPMVASAEITNAMAGTADTTVFLYSPAHNQGFHIAIANSDSTFRHTGQLFSSDYSQWGAEKRMYSPHIMALKEGGYVAVFQVNDYAPCFAVAYSDDLVTWRPQDYPRMSQQGCFAPVVARQSDGTYAVLFKTKQGEVRKTLASSDFRHFSADKAASISEYDAALQKKDTVMVGNRSFEGYKMNVSKPVADMVAAYFAKLDDDNRKNAENLNDDNKRFAAFEGQTIKASLTINASEKKAISDKFIGVFFEDISYAADGGLYAEMVQNRDFEYIKGEGRDKDWGPLYAWTSTGKLTLSSGNPLSHNNPHHIIVTGDTLYNSGWDGMKVVSGERYDFSFFVCPKDVKTKRFTVALVDGTAIIAKARIKTKGKSDEWNKYEAELVATANAKSARLMLIPEGKGSVALDMISLFPHETFCHRKNGLRKDLAQAIADLKPRFIRFPGGCMTHGDGLDNIYHWHHTVGPLHERKPDTNIWRYHQTRGLGFYEYFQYCEDIGAEPLPVLAAGVPCQNSAANEHGYGGQQGGVPMEHMQAYIQEFLDLIEWANGNPATSKWAKMRADAGHPEPFNLKYIGVGNEDLVSTVFEERCLMISKAIKEKYPDIILCGTVGPFHAPSSDYVEGWKFANQHRDVFDMVDEHYYESVGWFLNNQHYYDHYDRTGPKVYLGEYAARVGKGGVDCALAEAVHLCNVERNADVVTMTSYAPLLSKNGHSNWSPDMMYFDNHRVDKTPSYYTQWLFGNYAGDNYISSVLKTHEAVANRIAASVVTDSKTGKRYLRIVNVLPVQVSLTLDGSLPVAATLKWQGFSGKPGQQRVKLLQGEMPANNIVLPPYSFYVMEI